MNLVERLHVWNVETHHGRQVRKHHQEERDVPEIKVKHNSRHIENKSVSFMCVDLT